MIHDFPEQPRRLSRRWFLSIPLFAPVAALTVSARADEYRFHYDHVLGTSLDLIVWTARESDADRAEAVVLAEIDRLSGVLSTYSPLSEISRLDHSTGPFFCSRELFDVLATYAEWSRRTAGAVASELGAPSLVLNFSQRTALRRTTKIGADDANGPRSALNVDALGKAYIIDRAVAAARREVPAVDGLFLNIGGDIVVSGRTEDIGVTHPFDSHDNSPPLTTVRVSDHAIATSGSYARGWHIIDPRSGRPAAAIASATVIARDALTANALATVLCVLSPVEGLPLVQATPGAHALVVAHDGRMMRTDGFASFERPRVVRASAPAIWPAGYELALTLTLKSGDGGFRAKRPYAAVWVEDATGKIVKTLAVWGTVSRYLPELSTWWTIARRGYRDPFALTRATRPAGQYQLGWNGLDDNGASVPSGTYRITIEVSREHGYYSKQSGVIPCLDKPATIMLRDAQEFEPVNVHYGPRAASAGNTSSARSPA
jgi:thiamine biosynthesis lipoprotein ApbE